jgi:transitional endoplasmic reticulum ATPase
MKKNVRTLDSNGVECQFTIKKAEETDRGFKDVIGMEELKALMTDRVLFPLTDEVFKTMYNGHPLNVILLYGPPGCGKSYIAEKFAEESKMNFIYVLPSDLGSTFFHGSQIMISALFNLAEQNAPCIICFDEIDAMIGNRDRIVQETIAHEVNEFLAQTNNCWKRGIFVIGTTNRVGSLDPAMLRKGRLDEQIYVPMPDAKLREALFKYRLEKVCKSRINYPLLAKKTDGYVISDIDTIVNVASIKAARNRAPVTQKLLATVIDETSSSVTPEMLVLYERI